MKGCVGCKYAVWKKTANGRMHPSGDGRCVYKVTIPALPQSMYWQSHLAPSPLGGYINRKAVLKDHCVYFVRDKT